MLPTSHVPPLHHHAHPRHHTEPTAKDAAHAPTDAPVPVTGDGRPTGHERRVSESGHHQTEKAQLGPAQDGQDPVVVRQIGHRLHPRRRAQRPTTFGGHGEGRTKSRLSRGTISFGSRRVGFGKSFFLTITEKLFSHFEVIVFLGEATAATRWN